MSLKRKTLSSQPENNEEDHFQTLAVEEALLRTLAPLHLFDVGNLLINWFRLVCLLFPLMSNTTHYRLVCD
ncbi:unnamed protein product [Sphagnum troendelagicum]|uniref:Uncharacterized protein n=1 Tax=Sphagnum troendelagicum TaxID=128251 RepID=A0ABP0TVG5_9BRYO